MKLLNQHELKLDKTIESISKNKSNGIYLIVTNNIDEVLKKLNQFKTISWLDILKEDVIEEFGYHFYFGDVNSESIKHERKWNSLYSHLVENIIAIKDFEYGNNDYEKSVSLNGFDNLSQLDKKVIFCLTPEKVNQMEENALRRFSHITL